MFDTSLADLLSSINSMLVPAGGKKRKSTGNKPGGGKAVKAEQAGGPVTGPVAQILDWFCVSI